ncbi:hypothetical protein RJ639_010179 [Escallonia herrerae]|uniref:F-box domain-containing protein n=1 Tax=Escallonia herrerae TaxID=1293975 RepID=A0AA89ATI5_9ASTE|nr:hypothetical protein RJ639_010179 [Escallonia herrerae]
MEPNTKESKKPDLMVESEEEFRPWSNLPDDILRQLIEKLYPVDRVRFCAVCRNWQIPIKGIQSVDKFPWLMTYLQFILYDEHTFEYTLADPIYHKSYTVREKSERERFYHVHASKFGWLLLRDEQRSEEDTTCFLFFTPFDKKFIELPVLTSSGYDVGVATFSSSPACSDCTVVAIGGKPCMGDENYIVISTYRSGDENWSSKKFCGQIFEPVKDVAYSRGKVYCSISYGLVLGAYDVADKTWILLVDLRHEGFGDERLDSYRIRNHLIESDGEILLAIHPNKRDWRVYRFDFSRGTWVVKQSLSNRALFLGVKSFSFAAASGGDTRDIADMIYYHELDKSVDFSLTKSSSVRERERERERERAQMAMAEYDEDDGMMNGDDKTDYDEDDGMMNGDDETDYDHESLNRGRGNEDEKQLFGWCASGVMNRIWIQPPY